MLSIPDKVFNRVLLNRLKDAVDPHLRDNPAGFRKNRSCADLIVTLRVILKQSLKLNSPLCVKFIDCEKTFDSFDKKFL